MPLTLGYHWVKTCYGLWLPGDARGHWSSDWDEKIGYTRYHMLNDGDPVRLRMARELMTHPEVLLSPQMIGIVERVIGECVEQSPWQIAAASVEKTHIHLLITYNGLPIEKTVKWISQQMTRAIHLETDYKGLVWGRNDWTSYIFDSDYFMNCKHYIERHNERRGAHPRPYEWVSDILL